jgi:hypothetical protein
VNDQSPYLLFASEHSKIEHGVKVFEYSQLSQELELVHKILGYYSTACVACALRGPEEDAPKHLFRQCMNHPSPVTVSQGYREFKTKVKYTPGTCYQCGILQKVGFISAFSRVIRGMKG